MEFSFDASLKTFSLFQGQGCWYFPSRPSPGLFLLTLLTFICHGWGKEANQITRISISKKGF